MRWIEAAGDAGWGGWLLGSLWVLATLTHRKRAESTKEA